MFVNRYILGLVQIPGLQFDLYTLAAFIASTPIVRTVSVKTCNICIHMQFIYLFSLPHRHDGN